MSHQSLRSALEGVAFTVPTPFTSDGSAVVHEHLASNLVALENEGGSIFVPCGNTGEYYSLSHEERVAVVETTVKTTSENSIIVAGAGGSTKTVLRLIEEYERLGVDAVMVMNPNHVYIDEGGLIDYYERIANSTDLGVVVYKRGERITETVLEAVTAIENVVAVKYAVNDVDGFSQAVHASHEDVTWLTGIAERFAPSYAMEGADGFTTGIGNVVPEQVLALQEALEARNWKEAKRLRDVLRSYENIREEPTDHPPFSSAKNVPAVKHGLDVRGWHGGPVREPLRPLSSGDRKRVERMYERIREEPTYE